MRCCVAEVTTVKPNFSGEYNLDRSACVLSAAASSIATAVLRIDHEDPRFGCYGRFASATDAMEFTFERRTDGDEHSSCRWEHDTLVTEDQIGAPEAPVVMTWRYELTDGGRHLRTAERIRGGGRDQDNVWEFERQ